MSIRNVPKELRGKDKFHHIDMGFLNRRLCMSALPPALRLKFIKHQKPGDDHMTVLANDHLLVTMLLDSCESVAVPTLLQALALEKRTHLFRSTERLAPCPEVYEEARVCHAVQLDLDFGKPIYIAYHTESVVAWIGAEMEFALSQAVASGDTFEHRPSECGHCVQDFLADLDLRDLPGEAAELESGDDEALPTADLRFYSAAPPEKNLASIR